MTPTVLLKREKEKGGNAVYYIHKGTVLKELAAKIEQVKPAFLFRPSRGTFR
jgi:hypothetical protein